MANVKITDYPELTTPADTDLVETVDDVAGTPTSKKLSWTNIKAFLKTYFDGLYGDVTAAANITANYLVVGADGAKGVKGLAAKPLIQVVNTQTGEVATGTTSIPQDNTIPQITEGDEYMTRTITPKSVSNILIIEVLALMTNTNSDHGTMALFKDAVANALSASTIYTGANVANEISLRYRMIAGTTSEITFRVRIGYNGGGTTIFNGTTGGRLFGGVVLSSITITEVTA